VDVDRLAGWLAGMAAWHGSSSMQRIAGLLAASGQQHQFCNLLRIPSIDSDGDGDGDGDGRCFDRDGRRRAPTGGTAAQIVMPASGGGGAAVHWFRKGLRLHDNPALLDAARTAAAAHAPLYPVFVLDPWFLHPSRVGVNRVRFLLQSLQCLSDGLREHNSRLLVLRGKPDQVLLDFMRQHDVRHLTFESDHEPYARERDARMHRLAEDGGVHVRQHCSHTLYDPAMLLAKNGGTPPKTYRSMLSLLSKAGAPPRPVDTPAQGDIPALPPALCTDAALSIPTLHDLGYCEEATAVIPGGEREALRRLDL
jgi:cryptochrome